MILRRFSKNESQHFNKKNLKLYKSNEKFLKPGKEHKLILINKILNNFN